MARELSRYRLSIIDRAREALAATAATWVEEVIRSSSAAGFAVPVAVVWVHRLNGASRASDRCPDPSDAMSYGSAGLHLGAEAATKRDEFAVRKEAPLERSPI